MRLNLTQHGESYQIRSCTGMDRLKHFLELRKSGAWSFLVGGVICLVDSGNERGLRYSVDHILAVGTTRLRFYRGATNAWGLISHSRTRAFPLHVLGRDAGERGRCDPRVMCNSRCFSVGLNTIRVMQCFHPGADSRSVMPLDALGCTRTTLTLSTCELLFRCSLSPCGCG